MISGISESQVSLICQKVQTFQNYREKHLMNHERWFKKRFGIRPNTVNWPWPGASNLHLPLIDKTIRRAKPNFYNAIDGIRPTVTFSSTATGDDLEMVMGIERTFDNMLHDDMKIAKPLYFGIDKMLEKGYFVGKVIQEYTPEIVQESVEVKEEFSQEVQDFIYAPETTDEMLVQEIAAQYNMDIDDPDDRSELEKAVRQIREGKDIIEFQREVNLTPHPSLFIKDPMNISVPVDTCNIEDARMVEDRIPMTCEDMLFRAESKKWDYENTMGLLAALGYNVDAPEQSTNHVESRKEFIKTLEERREGVEGHLDDTPLISEIFFWHKWEGDRLPSRSVLTIHRDHPEYPLKFRKYDYEDTKGKPDKWPFGQVTFEIVSDRYYSPRGYAQMLDSLQTEITNNHNAKQNYMTITNSLSLKVKKTANISTGWVPGQPFYVNRMDDVQEFDFSQRDLSFDNEERGLKGWAEEYIGLLDSTLTSPQAGVQGGDARTKAEIDAVTAITVQVAGGDIKVFQLGMSWIYQMIWNRWMQFGPETIKYTNGVGAEIEIEKEEIKNRFKMVPSANIGNLSKDVRYKKAIGRFQLYQGNSMVNQEELVKDTLINDDERLVQRLFVPQANHQQSEIERQAFEIDLINKGYTVIPKPQEDDELHMQVIKNYLEDPVKRATLRPERVEALTNHYKAHEYALVAKQKSSTRGGRVMQEVAKIATGESNMEANANV